MTNLTPEFKRAVATANPIAKNVTVNGMSRSGLRQGDWIRSNGCVTAKVLVVAGDLIAVETLKGTLMNISSDNVIDLIC